MQRPTGLMHSTQDYLRAPYCERTIVMMGVPVGDANLHAQKL